MNFINNIPYQLGSQFNENNIDLELREDFNVSSFYNSYRYSEIYLFGKIFESKCLLQFSRNKLITIQYKIKIEYLNLFKNSINEDLPANKQLVKDIYNPREALESYYNGIAVSLVDFNKEFFLFKLSLNPSLPRIKN